MIGLLIFGVYVVTIFICTHIYSWFVLMRYGKDKLCIYRRRSYKEYREIAWMMGIAVFLLILSLIIVAIGALLFLLLGNDILIIVGICIFLVGLFGVMKSIKKTKEILLRNNIINER